MSAPRMKHRLIAASDLEVLHFIYMDEENNRFMSYEPMDLAAFRSIFDGLVRAGRTHLLLDDTSIVGTFELRQQEHRSSHVATLGSFAMHPAFRGRGFGGKAIEEIVQIARARGLRRLELLVETDNPRAIGFYERHGFVKEGIFRGACRRASEQHDIDEIAMARLF
jgi:RimJ/RimL family protein N-acetyltransferase